MFQPQHLLLGANEWIGGTIGFTLAGLGVTAEVGAFDIGDLVVVVDFDVGV
jgi:hypothetical protein